MVELFAKMRNPIVLHSILVILVCVQGVLAQPAWSGYSMARCYFNGTFSQNELEIVGIEAEHAIVKNSYVEAVVDRFTIQELQHRNVRIEILVPDAQAYYQRRMVDSQNEKLNGTALQSAPPSFNLGTYGSGYFTLSGIYSEFARMQTVYPELVANPITIGKTFEKRDMFAWKFGSTSSGNKPEVLYTSLHHAREPGGALTLIYFLWWLLDNYKTDSEAAYLLNNRQIWVIPVVNPDGYAYNEKIAPSGGGLWRKNRRQFNDSTYGVDLNRNYGPQESWDAKNGGSSEDMKTDTYRGTSAFSELETQAIRDFCKQHSFVTAINYHTYGNLLIYPFDHIAREPLDSTRYRLFAYDVTRGSMYSAGRSIQTVGYNVRGDADTWLYLPSDKSTQTFACTIEAGTVADGFWAPKARLIPQCAENLRANLQAAWSAAGNVVLHQSTIQEQSNGLQLLYRLANIGSANISDAQVQVSAITNTIEVDTTPQSIGTMQPGNVQEFMSDVTTKSGITNGTNVKVEVRITHSGVLRRDTISFKVYKPTTIVLYDSATSENVSKWGMNKWNKEYDNELKRSVLSDSPLANYKGDTANYVVSNTQLDLTDCKTATLTITSKWNMDAHNDYATIEASTDFGFSWIPLHANRMKLGLGLSGSKQKKGVYGFAGNNPIWTTTECPLDTVIGKKCFLRFGMLSDAFNNFDGWKISEVIVKKYPEINTEVYVDENPKSTVQLQDNTLNIIPNHNFRLLEFYDILGRVLYKTDDFSKGDSVVFPFKIESGLYVCIIHYSQNLPSQTFLVIK